MATASENNTNSTRPQREAKKRAAAAICEMQGNAKKKRVVLGDLTNVSDAATAAVAVSETQKRKKIKLQKPVPTVDTPEKVDGRSDPQLGGPYVSDIYEYLCGMEVLGFYVFFFLPFSGG